eukprot:Protomagalhaensia_sp_Gyna_25__2930@NODE_2718_length_927_cov_273_486486_g2266_i0_p1_GENE_NODE_2718_length_927_cov_273_486486_g2266_i0NODE_2718_length_927_cov_273_486486_g2266_i0_p1_ORF_typecomplete_len259_score15_41Peptidase_M50B/PF13398_6/2_1e41Gaa1/PF04114_14/0_14Gaa1/PF04114_14/1_1e03DUF2371/PF10177_9/4e02DUF2371/PF10177_9/0_53Ndc1_Nup/PF09531_10/0_27Sec61_beta/PF03911_16/2_7e03Sec61_beta/PF03911_16/5_4e03Sec61_beta/PF03911_16/1_9e03Sec61_beta/PF03911_16/5_6Sec61_beta/PF03911_16/1_4e04ALMT/PF1
MLPDDKCCCNATQVTSLVVIGGSILICLLLWRSVILAPVKLVVTFLHEASHALATYLTCGKVTGIEVNENFGGVTYSKGGNRCITLTAGYIGSVLWGCIFLFLSVGKTSRLVGAAIFIAACVITPLVLRVKTKRTCGCRSGTHIILLLCILTLGAIMAAFWVWREMKTLKVDPVQIYLLSIGTWCTLHALYDVTSDTFIHKVDDRTRGQSDAVMLANEICGTARMWGLIWSLVSFTVFGLAISGIVIIESSNRDDCFQ